MRADRRFVLSAGLMLVLGACAPRHHGGAAVVRTIAPPPPPPPGSTTVWGPLRVESLAPVRHEVGWTRDFVRAARIVGWDVVIAQDRASCPDDVVAAAAKTDERGCRGVDAFDKRCKIEPPIRARVELEVVHALELTHRCAGDPAPYAPGEDDPRTSLSNAGRACFKARNKLKPESTWTSLYELTELKLAERVDAVRTAFPAMLGRLLAGEGKLYCRDDGAYLDGTAGAPLGAPATPPIALAEQLVARAGAPPAAGDATPLTGDGFKTEHALWESCNAQPAKDSLVARERCMLLRQLDRFLRDVEDVARPETPKGLAAPAGSGGAP
jgi:hypothetical protein